MRPLYKYVANIDAIRSILAGAVKFTPIAELNDPSELVPSINSDAVGESLNRFREHGYSDEDMVHLRRQGNLLAALAPQHMVLRVPQTKEEATRAIRLIPFHSMLPLLERRLHATAEEMSSKVGLFCLSERFDSLPMWAHYARNAAGVAVEFNGLEEVFTGDDTGILRQVRNVSYPPTDHGMTFDPQSHENLFFSKLSDWQYEREVRVVLPLSDCRVEITSWGKLHLFEIKKSCVTRLIIGWNIAPEAVRKIECYVREIDSKVEIVRAEFSSRSVKLRGGG